MWFHKTDMQPKYLNVLTCSSVLLDIQIIYLIKH
jgi:hypothetical protein